jgi:hypothetical protein
MPISCGFVRVCPKAGKGREKTRKWPNLELFNPFPAGCGKLFLNDCPAARRRQSSGAGRFAEYLDQDSLPTIAAAQLVV